jgi:hypothetical protein
MNYSKEQIDEIASWVAAGTSPLVDLLYALRAQEVWLFRCFEAWPHAFATHTQLTFNFP